MAHDECYTTLNEAEKLVRYIDENIIRSDKNGASFYSFWLCYKTRLTKTFNQLLDSGNERVIEKYDEYGNVIEDNHMNIFNRDNNLWTS